VIRPNRGRNRLNDKSTLEGVSPGGWTFNADDELSSETYDANGNVTSTGGKSFTYDSENHMVSMSATGTSASKVYDAFGNRVSKTVNGVTTQYLVEDDKNPTGYPQVFDELTNGAVSRTYTYGLQRINEEQVVEGAWTPSFYGYDGGGNVRQLTSSAGAVTDSYEYDAYGNHWTAEGTTPNNMLYRGEEWDPDLSLLYLRARYMNPLTGRFLSRDPEDGQLTDPKSLHKYLYAGGDPVNAFDPSGRNTATLPFPQVSGGGDLVEYGLIISAIGLGTVAADKSVACALQTAYNYIAKSVGAGALALPVPAQCTAKCPPCDPPSGTQCYETHSGHTHNGWDPHSHIWQQNQNPNTCKCFWNRGGGTGGATQFPPIGMSECSSYPSWPTN
jgi:RHS repeat-associated protein